VEKDLYEVRVREKVGPDRWVKKSKFYRASKPRDAREHYKGGGTIMWVEKTSREKILGTGDFFSLGARILSDFKQGGDLTEEPELARKLGEKQLVRERRFYATKERETTY
jgi:hypothetical protein